MECFDNMKYEKYLKFDGSSKLQKDSKFIVLFKNVFLFFVLFFFFVFFGEEEKNLKKLQKNLKNYVKLMKIFNIKEKEIIKHVLYGNIRDKNCQNLETSFFTSKKMKRFLKIF